MLYFHFYSFRIIKTASFWHWWDVKIQEEAHRNAPDLHVLVLPRVNLQTWNTEVGCGGFGSLHHRRFAYKTQLLELILSLWELNSLITQRQSADSWLGFPALSGNLSLILFFLHVFFYSWDVNKKNRGLYSSQSKIRISTEPHWDNLMPRP